MDTLTFIEKLVEHLTWPILIVAVCLILKKPIIELLKRLSRAQHKDTVFDFSHGQQQLPSGDSNIADAMPQDSLGLVKEAEDRINQALESLELKTDSEKLKVLLTHHADLHIRNTFSEINHLIYGSQLALLQALNVQPDKVESEFLASFFEGAKKQFPDFYKSYSFENYLNFLKATGLVNTEGGKYFITVLGRGFLRFITENGINTNRIY
jgi:hypothetical protein